MKNGESIKESEMVNDEIKPAKKFDLEERTSKFAENIIEFSRKIR